MHDKEATISSHRVYKFYIRNTAVEDDLVICFFLVYI